MQKAEILSARSDYQMCTALPRIQRETLFDFSSHRVQLAILYLAKIKVIYKKSIRSIFHGFDYSIYASF